MANLARTAKPANHWTYDELEAYQISVEEQDFATFFGIDQPPEPHVDPDFLTARDHQEAASDEAAGLIAQLDSTIPPLGDGDTFALDDFYVFLYKQLGYPWRGRNTIMRKRVPLHVCGEYYTVKLDVSLLDRDRNNQFLLVQENQDTLGKNLCDPVPRMVAKAIAVFEHNNNARAQADQQLLDEQVIPGIVSVGTMPTFFKIRVTPELVRCVRRGVCPTQPTIVYRYQPPVARRETCVTEGMKPLDNRRLILSCFEAFKNVIGI